MRKLLLSLTIASTLTACAAYREHPVATVAASATIALGAGGVCVGIGECGGEYGDTWQDNAAHYGIGQISVLAVMGATGLLVWAIEDARAPR